MGSSGLLLARTRRSSDANHTTCLPSAPAPLPAPKPCAQPAVCTQQSTSVKAAAAVRLLRGARCQAYFSFTTCRPSRCTSWRAGPHSCITSPTSALSWAECSRWVGMGEGPAFEPGSRSSCGPDCGCHRLLSAWAAQASCLRVWACCSECWHDFVLGHGTPTVAAHSHMRPMKRLPTSLQPRRSVGCWTALCTLESRLSARKWLWASTASRVLPAVGNPACVAHSLAAATVRGHFCCGCFMAGFV